jgi:alpha-glucosidase
MVDADPVTLPDPPYDRAGRDGARTPMQWTDAPGGGFTTGTPWLPLADHRARNVAAQDADAASFLNLYRRLIVARRASPALARGEHRSFFGVAPDVLAWLRESDEERVLCLVNVAAERRPCHLAQVIGRVGASSGRVVVATSERTGEAALDDLVLAPLEAVAVRV